MFSFLRTGSAHGTLFECLQSDGSCSFPNKRERTASLNPSIARSRNDNIKRDGIRIAMVMKNVRWVRSNANIERSDVKYCITIRRMPVTCKVNFAL